MAPALDYDALLATLRRLGISDFEVEEVMAKIGEKTLGLLLYGSRARGDYVASSDFDVLRFTTAWDSPTFKAGRVSVSSYTYDQLLSANGTLFGTHLQRDGRVIIERNSELTELIASLSRADPQELLERVKRYSIVLSQPQNEKEAHFSGMVRLARYLLRTAVYATAMKEGEPCFSVRELAIQFNDPELATLLASDTAVTGDPSASLLEELITRLASLVGPLPEHHYGSLQALAVAYWDVDRNLAALALRAADEDDADSLDYSDLPKVLL